MEPTVGRHPESGHWCKSVALVFAVAPAPLALVGSLSAAFQLIQHVESVRKATLIGCPP